MFLIKNTEFVDFFSIRLFFIEHSLKRSFKYFPFYTMMVIIFRKAGSVHISLSEPAILCRHCCIQLVSDYLFRVLFSALHKFYLATKGTAKSKVQAGTVYGPPPHYCWPA